MKVWLIFSAVIAITSSANNPEAISQEVVTGNVTIQGRSLSSIGKNKVENFINHLPCGWPEAGIPPLAPYAKKEIILDWKTSFSEVLTKLEYFRIDGLDIMLIERLKVSYTFSQHVKFDFTFPKIVFSGKYVTDVFVDLMKEYGINVRYDGKGDFELILKDLNVQGYFKYKMPLLPIFSSTRIYKFDGSLTLGNVESRIGGLIGNGKLNRLINDKIEQTILMLVNYNRERISEEIKEKLIPLINEKLEGRNVWTFFKSLFGQQGKICYPPPFPW